MTTEATLDDLADAAAALGELRSAAREILRRAWSAERLRNLLGSDEPAFDDELWATIRGIGWTDVLVSEDQGGGAATVAELCALTEEAGAAAAPIPLAATAAAAFLEDRCVDGTPILLDGVASAGGGRQVAVSGIWPLVRFGATATRLLIRVEIAGGPTVVAVDPSGPGAQLEPVRPLDHSPAAAIELADAPAQVVLEGDEAARRYEQAERIAMLGSIAELVGVARAANEAACDYAKVRVAFGRPIGTYQAIKHRLVDQRSSIEVARALVVRAADAHQRSQPDAPALASLAAFWALDTLRAVPEGAAQVFGGIAYTWDHEAHVHLRRAACLAASLGARSDHRRRVAGWLSKRLDA